MNKLIGAAFSKQNSNKASKAGRKHKGSLSAGIIPKINVPWRVKAIEPHPEKEGWFRINWKSLCRDKYAPWGVGVNTCLYKV